MARDNDQQRFSVFWEPVGENGVIMAPFFTFFSCISLNTKGGINFVTYNDSPYMYLLYMLNINHKQISISILINIM